MSAGINSINSVAQSYDNNPYQSLPFANTAPVHLAAIRHLFGLTGAPIATAKVLELGAASGGNLIPMAIHYPQMQCLGVDISARQVELGKEHISALGLNNMQLAHLDLQSINTDFGLFDFIICHGVYSWVSAPVQAAILRICRENLSADGIALVSYNTYPGWREREVLRDAMLFHAANFDEQKVEHGFGMLEFMCELGDRDSLYIQNVLGQMNALKSMRRDYIAHEYLERDNQPLYFKDFHQSLSAHQLAYIGDANFASMYANHLNAEQRERLLNGANGNQIMLEQYCDFINNRSFRSSILCQREQETKIVRQFEDDQLAEIQISAALVELDNEAQADKKNACFSCGDWQLRTSSASGYFAAKLLAKTHPRLLKIGSLYKIVSNHLGTKFNSVEFYDLFRQLLTHGISSPCIDVNTSQHIGKLETLGEYPKMREKWRQFYQRFGYLVDACNRIIKIHELANALLPLLDGQHDWESIQAHVLAVTEFEEGESAQDRQEKVNEINTNIRQIVQSFAEYGLMEGKAK